MKKILVLAVAVVALSAAGIAYSALSQSGTFQKGTSVFGGGHAVIVGSDRTFSLYARNGHGTVIRNGTALAFTCATIVGNTAVLGGKSTVKGQYFMMEVVDNGLPVGGPSGDQISPFIIGTGAAPTTCPAPSDFDPVELDTVDAGDITVHTS